MHREGRRSHRLDPSLPPKLLNRGGSDQRVRVGGQKEAIPASAGPAAGPSQPLQERSHFGGSIDLDDPVEIPNIDAQLQRARGDDDAVACFVERLFGSEAFVPAKELWETKVSTPSPRKNEANSSA